MSEQKQKLEFGGVPGNFGMILGLPLFTAYLFFAVRFNDGAVLPGPGADWDGFKEAMMSTGRASVIYGVWFVFQALLQKYAPVREVLGAALPRRRPRSVSDERLVVTLGDVHRRRPTALVRRVLYS